MTIKIKFEESSKLYDFSIFDTDSLPFNEQQKCFFETCDYETLETRMMYHLFNIDTNMFILTVSDFKASKNSLNFSLQDKQIYF